MMTLYVQRTYGRQRGARNSRMRRFTAAGCSWITMARWSPARPPRSRPGNSLGVVQVAGDVAAVHACELRLVDRAARHDLRTARVEPAARRWVERARNVAGQHDLVAGVVGVRRQRGGEERLRVRMARPRDERARVARLDAAPEVPHGD